jgi:hypothetical protein
VKQWFRNADEMWTFWREAASISGSGKPARFKHQCADAFVSVMIRDEIRRGVA